jgi:hypothetical protein
MFQRALLLIEASVMTLVLTALVSCGEVPTSARLERGPRFFLDGSGRLASFRIYGPRPGHKIATPFDGGSLAWDVRSSEGYFKGALVRGLSIDFGRVPTGYVQTVPNGGAAPELPSRMVYYFFAETANAPTLGGFFYLDGDTPIEILVPSLCESAIVGDVRPLKCGTTDPYVEPTNLEQFVRENRVGN